VLHTRWTSAGPTQTLSVLFRRSQTGGSGLQVFLGLAHPPCTTTVPFLPYLSGTTFRTLRANAVVPYRADHCTVYMTPVGLPRVPVRATSLQQLFPVISTSYYSPCVVGLSIFCCVCGCVFFFFFFLVFGWFFFSFFFFFFFVPSHTRPTVCLPPYAFLPRFPTNLRPHPVELPPQAHTTCRRVGPTTVPPAASGFRAEPRSTRSRLYARAYRYQPVP